MPLDLGRLSKRRAGAVAATPSEEFTKHKGQDESVGPDEKLDIDGVTFNTPPEVLRNNSDSAEPKNVEINPDSDDVFDYDGDDYLSSYADNDDTDDNDDNDPLDFGRNNDYYLHDSEDISLGDDHLYAEEKEDAEPLFSSANQMSQVYHTDRTKFTSVPSEGSPILTEEETKSLLEPPLLKEEEEEEEDVALLEPTRTEDPDQPEDTGTRPERRFMFTPTPLVEETKLNQSFSYTIETFAIEVMNASEITNVSLSSFGDVSLIYEPDRLSLLKIGNHKFIGRPLSALDKQRLFYTINEFLNKCEEDGKTSVTIKLTQRVFYHGVPYTSLVATESELSEYAGIFGKTVYFNPDEPDELNLVAVIKCRE